METTGLTVGDWVYNTHNRQNEQIAEIDSGLVMLAYNDLYEYDEIEPIPLTPEILEKNGFKLRDGFLYHRVDDNPHQYDFKLKNGSDGYILEYNTYHLIIRYVHRLQRVLRLCSLNDLADNFKVEE